MKIFLSEDGGGVSWWDAGMRKPIVYTGSEEEDEEEGEEGEEGEGEVEVEVEVEVEEEEEGEVGEDVPFEVVCDVFLSSLSSPFFSPSLLLGSTNVTTGVVMSILTFGSFLPEM